MKLNQNETGVEIRNPNAECRMNRASSSFVIRHSSFPTAFTLTELLVVITIIAVLAGLITGAAVNALNKAKQASITLEIQQLSSAIEDFKNEYGAYPPNVFPNGSLNTTEKNANNQTLLRALKKAFPRAVEFTLPVDHDTGNNNVYESGEPLTLANVGLSPAEALVFWLQGFSSDPSRPFSGTDLQPTQIDDGGTTVPNVLTIDAFQPRYEFDRGRLRLSRLPDGSRRYITIYGAGGTGPVELQLYEYLAPGSEEPFVYFDTSRETPEQVVNNWTTTEFFYSSPTSGGRIYPLKQMKANAPNPLPASPPARLSYVKYVNARKFQILHCGLDDAWGDFSDGTDGSQGELDVDNDNGGVDFVPSLLFPTGPFIGDIADTVGNFGVGTLEDAQE